MVSFDQRPRRAIAPETAIGIEIRQSNPRAAGEAPVRREEWGGMMHRPPHLGDVMRYLGTRDAKTRKWADEQGMKEGDLVTVRGIRPDCPGYGLLFDGIEGGFWPALFEMVTPNDDGPEAPFASPFLPKKRTCDDTF